MKKIPNPCGSCSERHTACQDGCRKHKAYVKIKNEVERRIRASMRENGGSYMISKKLTSKAGITIPKALRADLGWQPSMAVDLAPQEDGSLIIRPHIDLCRFCGTHENVHKYKDVCVCSECSVKMKEAI